MKVLYVIFLVYYQGNFAPLDGSPTYQDYKTCYAVAKSLANELPGVGRGTVWGLYCAPKIELREHQ